MQQALLLVDMSNFNKKIYIYINIITNSALAKAGPETFFRSETNFQHLDWVLVLGFSQDVENSLVLYIYLITRKYLSKFNYCKMVSKSLSPFDFDLNFQNFPKLNMFQKRSLSSISVIKKFNFMS